MATTFESIRGLIRAAVLDLDCESYQYSNQVLNQQIRLTTTLLNYSYTESPEESFVEDLTAVAKATIALNIAIRLLLGNSSEFSYKTAVLSVTRKNNQQSRLVAFLQGLLDGISGGKFAIAVDTDFDALLQGFDRYINSINIADVAWNGSI